MIGFGQAIKLGFNRYVDFSGRSSRAEIWWWTLFLVLVSIVLNIVDIAIIKTPGLTQLIFVLAIILPSLAIGIRRLHDIDKSGWWILLHFVPFFIGSIVLVILACKRGSDEENKYGPSPLAAS